jgi:hypothetical protein
MPAPKKQIHWTIKLITDAPIEEARITDALASLGTAEVVTYAVKTVKA